MFKVVFFSSINYQTNISGLSKKEAMKILEKVNKVPRKYRFFYSKTKNNPTLINLDNVLGIFIEEE